MINKEETRDLINDLFEEEALVIGGLIAVHDLDDDFIWRLIKNLDMIRGKVLRRIEDKEPTNDEETSLGRSKLKPHPAIEDFLIKVRRA